MEKITTEAAAESKAASVWPLKAAQAKKPLLILGAILAAVLAAYLGLCAWAGTLDTFYPNYHMNGVDVAGMTVPEAQAALEADLFSQEITLYDAGTEEALTTCTLADLGYQPEDFAGDAQAWMDDLKNDGFLSHGWTYLAFLTGRYPGGSNWPDPNAETLRATTQTLSEELSREPQDTAFEVLDDAVQIKKAQNGRTVATVLEDALRDILTYSQAGYQVPVSFAEIPAKTLTAREIHDQVAGEMKNAGYDAATDTITPEQLGAEFDAAAAQAAMDAAKPGEIINIPAVIERPRVTAETLKDVLFRDVLGECRTHVGGTAARISNVKLASSAFHNVVLNTGDVFSYNETVGQRTAARGYQAAPAYVNGETVDEIGGGVCQPSSTLYLACLRANLEITERYAHRYAPAYIPFGMDATVSWNGPDYKFTNNTDYPIKIETAYAGGYLTVRILGTNESGVTAKITNETLSTTNWQTVYEEAPTLPAGTEKVKTTPYTGYKVRTYRNLYDADGRLISSAFEASSDYKVRNKVVLKGPAPAVTPKPPIDPAPTEPEVPVTGPGELPVEPESPTFQPEPPVIVLPEPPEDLTA